MTLAPKSYMGRIFLTPVKFSPEQGPQFWVNIGFNTAGNQIFPEWCVQMEGAVSKPDYDALMKDLKEYFDAEAGSPASVIAQNFGLNCGCLFAHFESGMNAVLARHAPRFPGGIIIERKDEEMSKPVANVPQEQSVDQYGNGLFATVGKSRRWPPVGYNLILQVPREKAAEVRGKWPPGAAPVRDRGGAVPAQLTIPAAVVQGIQGQPTREVEDSAFCGQCGRALGGSPFCKGCGARAGV